LVGLESCMNNQIPSVSEDTSSSPPTKIDRVLDKMLKIEIHRYPPNSSALQSLIIVNPRY